MLLMAIYTVKYTLCKINLEQPYKTQQHTSGEKSASEDQERDDVPLMMMYMHTCMYVYTYLRSTWVYVHNCDEIIAICLPMIHEYSVCTCCTYVHSLSGLLRK